MTLYFEDMPVGFEFKTAERLMTKEAIIDFARQWDPQRFHIDEEAAAASPYGGIIASGWQTLLTAFTLALETGYFEDSSIGSPGMQDVKWLLPVRPDDRIHAVGRVLGAKASTSKPDRGFLDCEYEIYNQTGAMVAYYRCAQMMLRRA